MIDLVSYVRSCIAALRNSTVIDIHLAGTVLGCNVFMPEYIKQYCSQTTEDFAWLLRKLLIPCGAQRLYGDLFLIIKIEHMWRQGSKPVICRFLDIALEAVIGEMGQNIEYWFNSAVAYEFAIICKVVTWFWSCLLCLIQNIALYCPAKLQNTGCWELWWHGYSETFHSVYSIVMIIFMKESNEYNFS